MPVTNRMLIQAPQRWRALALLAGCVVATSSPAQIGEFGTGGIRGVVRDSAGLGITGVQVTISRSTLKFETDEQGQFQLAKVPAGPISLHFRRLGFRPDTIDLTVLAGKTVPLDVNLNRAAISLDPVVITGRTALTGWRAGFYSRKDRGGGHFITREEIDRRNPGTLTDMFRMIPGARIVTGRGIIPNQIRFRGERCAPLTWLDGAPLTAGEFDLDALSPRSIEAMEIYAGSGTIPAQFHVSSSITSQCGTIVIWSREGQRAPVKRKTGEVSAAAALAQLVDAQKAFTSSEVDVAARLDSANAIVPVYPDRLHEDGIPGSVMAEFVVGASGQVDPQSFSVVFSSHPAFTEAVQRALSEAVYVPAVRKGYPVPQVVQHEFKFVPDGSRKRK